MKCVAALSQFVAFSSAFTLPSLQRRQANSAVSSSAFRRRAYHSSAILDGWLYIDGGEFSYSSGSDTTYQYSSSLLAIDLSQSWTNSTVVIQSNSKPAGVPDLVDGGMWVDEASKLLYTGFAGRPSTFGNGEYYDYGLYSFAPDGQGGGIWKNLNSTATPRFLTEHRPFYGVTGSGNGVGYFLGGFAVNASQADDRQSAIPISGLISYNFTSNELSNNTVTGITNAGEIQMGDAVFVPNFGPEGILLTFGGDQVGKKNSGDNFLDSTTVQVFDPSSGTWYEQATSGNIPEARKEFCMAGVASNNNTYEIFMYAGWGGNLGPAAIPYDEVFVLSLPSFNWFKASYGAANPRHALTCHSAGGGQMITIGGVNSTTNGPKNLYNDVFNTADQFTQGLAVFDISSMAWKSGYSVNRTEYVPAPVVQSYYNSNPRTPTFSSSGLQKLMSVQNFTAATTGTTSGSGTSDGFSTTKKSHTGAIVGGVIGGVAVLLIIGVVVYFLLRRKNKKAAVIQEMPGQHQEKHEMPAQTSAYEGTAYNNGSAYAKVATEMPAEQKVTSELPANENRYELS